MGGVSIPGVGGILGMIISQWGTSQHDGSFGSGTNEHPDGTREYLEHLQYKLTIHMINIYYTACEQKSFLFSTKYPYIFHIKSHIFKKSSSNNFLCNYDKSFTITFT